MMFAAVFGTVIGLLLLGTRVSLILSDQAFGFAQDLAGMVLFWVAEFTTAVTLVAAGFGLLTESAWGRPATLIAMGMLLCTVISNLGHHARRRVRGREWPMVGVSAALLVPTLISVGLVW